MRRLEFSLMSLLSISFTLFSYTHEINSFHLRPSVVLSSDGYADFKGLDVYGEPAEPQLPTYRQSILVEPDADLDQVQVAVHGIIQETVPGSYMVRPAPLNMIQDESVIPEGKSIVDGKDNSIYSANTFFPQSNVKVSNVGQLNYYKVVTVQVNPYQYNPVTLQLKRLSGGTIVVTIPRMADYARKRGTVYPMDRSTIQEIQYLVSNYAAIASLYKEYESPGEKPPALAVITTNAIKSASAKLSAFIDSKKNKGYTVIVATETEWGTGSGTVPDKVRAWIKSNYQQLNINHVLLIGNPNPTNGDLAMYKAVSTPTDWYFGELSSTTISSKDCMAEVHVGRIPVYSTGDITKLDKVFDKIIKYENAPKSSITWRFNAELAYKPCDANTQCYELGEQIRCSTLVAGKDWKWVRVYDKTYSLNPPPEFVPCNETNTQKAWKEQKPGCVFWDTHGSATSSSGMTSTTAAAGFDDNFPVFTFQGACLNAKPDVTNNLCYTLCVNGAIAANAATISVSYSPGEKDYTKSASIGGQEYWYAKFLIKDSLTTSAASDMARAKINGKSWANHCALVLYGDPTMSPYLCDKATAFSMAAPSVRAVLALRINKAGVHVILQKGVSVTMSVYTLNGGVVYSTGNDLRVPQSKVSWNYCSTTGAGVANGIYLVRLALTNTRGSVESFTTKVAVRQ